jgi:hypothetical protein
MIGDRIPWIPVVALMVVLSLIIPLWWLALPESLTTSYSLGVTVCTLELTSAPFIVLLLGGFLTHVPSLRGKIDYKLLTYLYAVAVSCSFFTKFPINHPILWFVDRIRTPVESTRLVPWFLAPSSEVCSGILEGGLPVPWIAWIPSIISWWALETSMCLLMVSIGAIFRRQFIDVEKVPFPHTGLAYEVIKNVKVGKEGAKRRPFVAGFVVGLVFQLLLLLIVLFPWFPDVLGWRTNTCGTGAQYISGPPFSYIAALGSFNKEPLAVAVAFMAPLIISFNVWFWYLIGVIVTQVAYAMGYYTGIMDIGGCGRGWCHPSPLSDPPLKYQAVLMVGGQIGLVAFYLITNRNYVAETIRAAMGRSRDKVELEKDEPVTYRTMYLLLAACFITMMAIWLSIGLSVLSALLLMVSVFIYMFVGTRLLGLAGIWNEGDAHGQALFKSIWPVAPQPSTTDWLFSNVMSRTFGADTPAYGWGGTLAGSLMSYKFSKFTGVHSKNVFRIFVMTSILVPALTLLTSIWFGYTVGYNRSVQPWRSQNGIIEYIGRPGYYDGQPASDPWVPHAILGFVIVGLLTILHSRFIWFPFEPIGFVLSMTMGTIVSGLWFSFLVAWVLKTALLRVGGSRAYEDYGVPVAGGFVGGCMLAILAGGLVGVVRFYFIPF